MIATIPQQVQSGRRGWAARRETAANDSLQPCINRIFCPDSPACGNWLSCPRYLFVTPVLKMIKRVIFPLCALQKRGTMNLTTERSKEAAIAPGGNPMSRESVRRKLKMVFFIIISFAAMC